MRIFGALCFTLLAWSAQAGPDIVALPPITFDGDTFSRIDGKIVGTGAGMALDAANATLPAARDNIFTTYYKVLSPQSADDAAYLQTAFNASETTPVWLTCGVYTVKSPLTIPHNGIVKSNSQFTYAVGAGYPYPNRSCAVIAAHNGNGAFATSPVVTMSDYSVLEGVEVIGTTFAGAVSDVIELAGSWITLDRVMLWGGTNGVHCLGGGVRQGQQISRSKIGPNATNGVSLFSGCSDSGISQSYIAGNGVAGIDFRSQGLRLVNNKVENNLGQGITTFNAFHIQIVGNEISGNGLEGILLGGTTNFVSIVGNGINESGTTATAGRDCHIGMAATPSQITMSGNVYKTGNTVSALAPNYVYCGAPTLTNSAILDRPTIQVLGIFRPGSDTAYAPAFTTIGTSQLTMGGAITALAGLDSVRMGAGTLGALDISHASPASANWSKIQGNIGGFNPPWTGSLARGGMFGWNKSASNGEFNFVWGTQVGTNAHLKFDTWDGTTYTNRATLKQTGHLDLTSGFDLPNAGLLGFHGTTDSTSSNYALSGNTTDTFLNAPSGNAEVRVANSGVFRVTSAGASMLTGTLTGLATPSAASDAATKAYADSIASGIVTHAAVAAASTANIPAVYANGASGVGATLTATGSLTTLDGYTLVTSDRVLIKDQTTTLQNGIYVVTSVGASAVLTRSTDFDAASGSEVAAGASVIVINGTTLARSNWVETGQGPFTIGTTPIIFSQVTGASSSGTVNAGTTNQLAYYATNGNTLSGLATANDGVLITSAGGVPSISSTIPSATQLNITSLGTVGTGVWNGTAIGLTKGGTNTDLSATGGTAQVVRQSSVGANLTVSQLAFSEISGLVTNAQLTNASVTVAGKTVSLGGSTTLACADLSNDAASCSTDTTNATNISSGTLALARLPTFAHTQRTVAADAGTTNTTGLMMGLAGTITPTATGTVQINVCGDNKSATIGNGVNTQLRTGTGAAPAVGAALTGTTRGSLAKFVASTVAGKTRTCLIYTVTGLALSTAVWIDVGRASVGGGLATFTDVDIIADEVP